MFKYKNDKGIMCIVDTSANKEYRLSMPHEVVEVVAILNAAQQSVQPTLLTRCPKCNAVTGWHHPLCEDYSPESDTGRKLVSYGKEKQSR